MDEGTSSRVNNSVEQPSSFSAQQQSEQYQADDSVQQPHLYQAQSSDIDRENSWYDKFYNAIRSNNVDEFEELCKNANLQKLDKFCSKAYKKLKSKNIQIRENMQLAVEKELINYQFSKSFFASPITLEQVKKMIGFMVETAEGLKNRNDEQLFLYDIQLIAKTVNIVKRVLLKTYADIPWEEIEFLINGFTLSYTRINKYSKASSLYSSVISKEKMKEYLNNFVQVLNHVVIDDSDINSTLPKAEGETKKREDVVRDIIQRMKNHSINLEGMYKEFQNLKDLYSLERIEYFLSLVKRADPQQDAGKLLIQKSLLVMGEYLKNSLTSPHLSDELQNNISLTRLFTLTQTVPVLRNILAHNTSIRKLKLRLDFEKDIDFSLIQKDLEKVREDITVILTSVKFKRLEDLVKDFLNRSNLEEEDLKKITEVIESGNWSVGRFESRFKQLERNVFQEFESIVEKYKNAENKNFIEKKFNEAHKYFQDTMITQNDEIGIKTRWNIICMDFYNTDKTNFKRSVQEFFDYLHEDVDSEIKVGGSQKILEIFNHISMKLPSTPDESKIRNLENTLFFLVHSDIARVIVVEECKARLESESEITDGRTEEEILKNLLQRIIDGKFTDEEYQLLKKNEKLKKAARKKISEIINLLGPGVKLDNLRKKLEEFKALNLSSAIVKFINSNIKMLSEVISILEEQGEELKIFAKKLKLISIASQSTEGNNNSKMLVGILKTMINEDGKKPESFGKDETNEFSIKESFACLEKYGGEEIYNKRKKLGSDKKLNELAQNLSLYLNHGSEQNYGNAQRIYEDLVKENLTLKHYGVDLSKFTDTNKLNQSIRPKLEKIKEDCKELAKINLFFVIESLKENTEKYSALLKFISDAQFDPDRNFDKHFDNLYQTKNISNLIPANLKGILKDLVKGEEEEKLRNYLYEHFSNRLELLKTLIKNETKQEINEDSTKKFFDACKGNEIFQYAVEIILLDLTDILEGLKIFKKDRLFLNSDVPILKGVTLRNYLAHGEIIIDALPFDPLRAIVLNALVLAKEGESIINFAKLKDMSKTNDEMKTFFSKLSEEWKTNKKELPEKLKEHETLINPLVESRFWADYLKYFRTDHSKTGEISQDGTDLDFKVRYEEDIRQLTSQEEMFKAIKENKVENVEGFIQKGADVLARTVNNWTVLHIAAKYSNEDTVKKVIEMIGADKIENYFHPSNENDYRVIETPMHIAAARTIEESLEVVNVLKDYFFKDGKNVYQNLKMPSHLAALNSNVEILKYFFEEFPSCIGICDERGWGHQHYAVLNNSKGVISFVIELYANEERKIEANRKDVFGQTPLLLAARAGNEKAVDYLLKYATANELNNDFRAFDSLKWHPLHDAASKGHVNIVEKLLEKGVKIGATFDCSNNNALHLAAANGHEKVVKALIEHRKNDYKSLINRQNKEGYSALHFAAQNGHRAVINILKEKVGLNELMADAETTEGFTPLHLAVKNGHKEIVEDLINKKNLQMADKYNKMPIHTASQKGHTEIIDFLLGKGAKIDDLGPYGTLPIHFAAAGGKLQAVEKLVEAGADVNAEIARMPQNVPGQSRLPLLVDETPLCCASRRGHSSVVNYLLEKGADPNKGDNEKPLHAAAGNGCVEIVRHLLNKEANPSMFNLLGENPLHVAAKFGHNDVVKVLLRANGVDINGQTSKGCRCTALHYASAKGYLNVVKEILLQNANVDLIDGKENTALHYAVGNGHLRIVMALCNKNANASTASTSDGATPLHLAAWYGYLDIVNFLLKKGVDVNVKDSKDHFTPLHCAAQGGCLELVKALLNKGSNIAMFTTKQATALHLAADCGHLKIVNLLLSKGADVNAPDTENLTPLDLAKRKGHKDVIEALLDKGAKAS